jgi:dihydroneopterin aldolase
VPYRVVECPTLSYLNEKIFMVDELKLAFEHPQERSKELLEINPLDRISLRNHIREVEIGAFHSERGAKQRIQFNIVVEVIIPTNPDDDVDLIFSYDTITSAIDNELSLGRINLLETLAERLASNILSDQRAVRAFIRIEKLDRGPGFLGVEIVRKTIDRAISSKLTLPDCLIVFIGNDLIQSDFTAELLEILALQQYPIIITVPPICQSLPVPMSSFSKMRVALLAMDQNAWILSDVRPDVQVVETRTELEWAIRNRKVSVWGPSKLVMSSDIDFKETPYDVSDLTLWLAQQINTKGIFSIGSGAKGLGQELSLDSVLKSKKIPRCN